MENEASSCSSENNNATNDRSSVLPPTTITVIGGGAFGTAMATIAARSGHEVILYVRNEEQCASINEKHINPRYLSDFVLLPNIRATTDLSEALDHPSLIILSLPAQIIPSWLAEHRDLISPTTLICNTAKGLYLKEKQLLSTTISSALRRKQPYALLSGPSFAKEMMRDLPTAVIVASKYLYHAVYIQRLLSSNLFRIYPSQDIIGVELGGALKNPLAIGAGMLEGLGMGINTMAAYVTRSSLELMELCKAMGGEPGTISGLSGVGDLMLTAFGELSRNRNFGKKLAMGHSIEELTASTTVEGVPTAMVAVDFANKCGLELPIFRSVAQIISGEMELEGAHLHLIGKVAHNLSIPPSLDFDDTSNEWVRLRKLSY